MQKSSAGKVLLNFSLAGVSRSSGVVVMVGDLNANEKKHSIFLTNISVLTYNICFPPFILVFLLISVILF